MRPPRSASDYAYHTQVMGWCDLGYNFVVDRFGRIYEGRAGGVDRLVQGAHAIGVNGETFGVAALGNFDVAEPPAVMLSAITRLVAWKLGLSGIDPRAATTLTSAGNERFAAGSADPRVRADLAPGHLVHRLPRASTSTRRWPACAAPPPR